MLAEGKKAVKVIIAGTVQGVCFRDWTVETATALALDGWVRNRADGTVEAMFVGAIAAVEEMLVRCQDGPPAATVTGIDVREAIGITGKGFVRKPTIDPSECRNRRA